ncbi:MAG TPA: hypothetical protein VIU62_20115 [Chloroflexota bacterium]|jgi:hypothetical protein
MDGLIGTFAWMKRARRSRVLLVVKSGAATVGDVLHVRRLCSQARADVALLITTYASTAAAQEAAHAAGMYHTPNGDVFPSLRVLTHADLRTAFHSRLPTGKLDFTLVHMEEGTASPVEDWRLAS